ncbi:hypothetical protein CMK11_05200 [Candidatus Poribacteria bacterium]|nr:hypothetical protein [Candidatus Poribacteria bacterium]
MLIAPMLVMLSAYAATPSQPLLAGAAMRVVTPERPAYLAGLRSPRLSDGVHDDLYARAVAMSQGDETVILVGIDVIGYARERVAGVKAELDGRGVPADGLIVCATHQHSGPDTIGIWGPSEVETGVDEEYMAFLAAQIVDAAAEAYANRRAARVSVGARTIPDGVARNARVPEYDDELRVLHFVDVDGDTISTLVNFTAHPETLWSDSTQITADYPQHVYRLVEEAFGGVTVFINGALGGMVTVASEENTFAECERIGAAVAETAIRATNDASVLEDPVLRHGRRVFTTPMDNAQFRAAVEAGVIPVGPNADTVETEVSLIRLSDVAIATVPGELLPAPGFALRDAMRERLGAASPFILGLANDELGYILAAEQFDLPLYEYEASMSVGRDIGPAVVENLIELMSLDR